MARYTGPKCKLCRREGVKLFLKGTKCEGDKCTLGKRPQPPGQHGSGRRRRKNVTEYGRQLREKQKAKRMYGVLERQFKNYVRNAQNAQGVAGEVLVQILESRLDNLIYRSGFAVSRAQARQFIRNKLFTVNGKEVRTPSQRLRIGDEIKPVSFEKLHLREGFVLPEWLKANTKERFVKVEALPKLEDFQESFDVQSIIEFYSR
jgi:small subunit ribosomal protein S4